MKQILQNLKSGETTLIEVPCPAVGRGAVLVKTQNSLISAGTERMLVEFSKGNLIQKARSQPSPKPPSNTSQPCESAAANRSATIK